jgi:hypothetical protein
MDKSNSYVITWTSQYGYTHYHAMVRCEWKGEERLHFACRMGPYKTFKKAVEGCETNRKLWDAFIVLSQQPGRRDGKYLELKARNPYVFMFMPKWVVPEADQHFVRMMFPCAGSLNDRGSDGEASESGSSSDAEAPCLTKASPTPDSGPASNAKVKGKSATKKTETLSKDTSSLPGTPVPTATEPAAGSKRKSKKSIAESSESSEPSSPTGKSKKRSAKAPSKNSRKRK